MVSGHCGHPDTLLILTLPLMTVSVVSCHPPHPVCRLSINTLLLTPLHSKCLLFTLLYYARNLFTHYLFSHQACVLPQHQPISNFWWLYLTNERLGPSVIVTLHNIGSLTFSHSQTSDHQSLNKYKQCHGSGLIHFEFPFRLSLSVISFRHMGRKTHTNIHIHINTYFNNLMFSFLFTGNP